MHPHAPGTPRQALSYPAALLLSAPILFLLMLAACSAPQASAAGDDTTQPATPASPAILPAQLPATESVTYACADGGSLQIDYAAYEATVHLDSGAAVLPRAESASSGGDDIYVGETVSLQRDGDGVQLHQGDEEPRVCIAG